MDDTYTLTSTTTGRTVTFGPQELSDALDAFQAERDEGPGVVTLTAEQGAAKTRRMLVRHRSGRSRNEPAELTGPLATQALINEVRHLVGLTTM